jgi:hypothetical protein
MRLARSDDSLEIELEPAACERAAADAVELLNRYNARVRTGGDAMGLASPSPESCRWCPYQMLCPAFWAAVDGTWTEILCSAAIGGPASGEPRPIHGGAAFALHLLTDEGTGPIGDVALAPLSPEIHASLLQIMADTRVRAIGLAMRADGTVAPTVRTVLARLEDLPTIAKPPAGT